MKKLVLSLVAVTSAAAVVVAPASAAYLSPKLTVTQGNATTTTGPAKTSIAISTSKDDDATARAVIYAPPGTVTLNQAPGTNLGTVAATVSAGALGGAVLPIAGRVEARAATGTYLQNNKPTLISAAATLCTGSATHAAFWVFVLTAAGTTLELPLFVDTTQGTAEGAFSSAKITVCVPPPDIPVDKGGATFGIKLIRAEFSLNGVFQPTAGVWFALLTPYTAGTGQANAGASVYSPASVAFGALSVPKVARVGKAKRVTGTLTQGGNGVTGAKVQVWAGATRAALRRIGTPTTKAGGAFSLATLRKVQFFQVRSVVAPRAAPQLCQVQSPFPVRCVNPTVMGFAVQSATVRG
jgi:hypothetical protein